MLTSRSKRMLLASFGGVAMLAGTAGPAMAATFTAMLNGDSHVLAGGDTNGWGRVRVNVDNTFNQVCADIEVRSVGRVRSVDIYRGGPGVDGQPVIHLDRPDDGDEDDCDSVGDALADDISRNPGQFYVLVRTDDFARRDPRSAYAQRRLTCQRGVISLPHASARVGIFMRWPRRPRSACGCWQRHRGR